MQVQQTGIEGYAAAVAGALIESITTAPFSPGLSSKGRFQLLPPQHPPAASPWLKRFAISAVAAALIAIAL